MDSKIIEKLVAIEGKLDAIEASQLIQRDVLTFKQARVYLDISASHLYKLTSQGKIPHSKPNGKRVYFDRKELDRWLLRNPIKTQDEIEEEATRLILYGERSKALRHSKGKLH